MFYAHQLGRYEWVCIAYCSSTQSLHFNLASIFNQTSVTRCWNKPNVSKSGPKISHSWFNSKINVFQKSPKSHSPTFRRKCVAKNFQKLPNLVTLNQTRSGTDPINKFLRKFDSFTIFKHLDWLKILSILSDCFKN